MKQFNSQRRRWLSLGGIMLGASLIPNFANAILSTPKPMVLKIRNINTGETLVASHSGGHFATATLGKLNYIMRDRRTNQVRAIDPKLYLKLTQILSRLGMRNAEIQMVSGYRSAQTNAKMHSRSRSVASNSYHIQGKAVDFYIQGVALSRIKAAAEGLSNGGVGYYPRSNFVHVDTGPVRTWRG